MEDMFYNCKSLKEINFNNNFNTDNVINMAGLFHGCSSLEKLNLNNFNTNNVTDMSYMFHECFKLEELYVNNFYTNSLTGVRCMFYGVSKQLKEKIKKANEKIKAEAFLW
jgi:surface protein